MKKFWVQKNFRSKKILGPKIFYQKNLSQNVLCTKKFESKKLFLGWFGLVNFPQESLYSLKKIDRILVRVGGSGWWGGLTVIIGPISVQSIDIDY